MAVSEDFRKRLNEIIFDLDISKNDFNSKVGVNKSVISHATVYGIVPCLTNLIKIADKLDLSLDYLLEKLKIITFI